MKRVSKKLLKKKEKLIEKKKEHNRARKLNCLYCKKSNLKRWSFY